MTRWILFAALLSTVGIFNEPPSYAQSAAKRPEFEVASIKLNKACDSRAGGGSSSSNSWAMKCRPLRWYIEVAYAQYDGPRLRIPDLDVVGGPRWVDTEMYDISAKAERDTPRWQMASLMLQSLLEERFKLSVHTEAKDTSVYALTVVRNDPRLKRSTEGSCIPTVWNSPSPTSAPGTADSSLSAMRASIDSPQKPCGNAHFRSDGGNTIADWYGISMNSFAGYGLPSLVQHRPVVDKTGLTGLFDIHLEYSDNDARSAAAGLDGLATSAVATKPSIFRALEEQLGLKLTSDRVPVGIIVIDHAERPSEN
jgi:uncharacterized protein (TIGR03435 family)